MHARTRQYGGAGWGGSVGLCVAAAVLGLGCSAGSTGSGNLEEQATGQVQQAAVLPGQSVALTVNVAVDIPADIALSALAVSGAQVDLGDRVKVEGETGGYAPIGGSGTLPMTIGGGAFTGRVVSKSKVVLRQGATVDGSVVTASTIDLPPAYTINGKKLTSQNVPTKRLTRKANFAARVTGVSLEPNQVRALPIAPGNYATLTLKQGSKASLVGGEYFFDEINIEPGATLTVNNSAGTTYVFSNRITNFKGVVAGIGAAYPSFVVYYLGTTEALISAPFRGSILAPNGTLHLGTVPNNRHEGSFIAKHFVADPDVVIKQRPIPWGDVRITVSKPQVCPGESFLVTVQARDTADPSKTPTVLIDGAPSSQAWDQAVGGPGARLIPVSVTMSDGSVESRIASVQVVACPTAPSPNPVLYGEANIYEPDTVDLTLGNAQKFEDGTQTYTWNFGDGTSATSTAGAVSHKFDWSQDPNQRSRAVDVTVTVKRPGLPNVAATRTFVVWNTYALSKARGAIEPPTSASPVLTKQGPNLTGEVTFKNLEPSILTLNRTRIDRVACDPNANASYGTVTTTSLSVPAKGQLKTTFSVPSSGVPAATCALNVHYWGSTAAGTPAQASVQFELPRPLGSGVPLPEFANRVLNHVVEAGLVENPSLVTEVELHRLYRDRKIRYSATNDVFYQAAGAAPGVQCDPDNPGTAPGSGFSCQATGEWESDSAGPSGGSFIANAMKGDSVVVRSCSGFVKTLMAKVDPPQVWTHSGILTNNRFEITQSTGEDSWLQAHPNGVADKPTDGFEEHALKYLWPGTLTSTVQEAFDTGRSVATPEGPSYRVVGFNPSEARCNGDRNIVYPRVVKPAPELDSVARPRLIAAADSAKQVRGHYRFGSYSVAQDTAANDPNGPDPIDGGDGRSQTYGRVPTVCSQLIRFGLKANGATVDADKLLPTPSDVTGNPADGLFFYDADERRAAADALYSALHNKVVMELETLEAQTDDYWWAGASAAVVGGLVLGPPGAALGAIALVGGETSGELVQWSTDAPDDVANQVTNCFASDFCSEDAKDKTNWKDPGSGFAVSPDDIVNYYDAPKANGTGGLYGYHERMVYRGKRYRPIFTWQASPGTRTITGTVVEADGTPAGLASVTLQGTDKVAVTDSSGKFTMLAAPSGNLSLHAQKWEGPQDTGVLREGDSCYVPDAASPPLLLNVDCKDFATPLSTLPTEDVVIKLHGPSDEFRQVVVSGTVRMTDCDCCGYATCSDIGSSTFYETCLVSPLERVDTFSVDPDQLCEDEVGVSISGKCTLLPDNHTVLVEGSYKFYEAGSGSCGGGEEQDSINFSQQISAGASADVYAPNLSNGGVCISPFPPVPFDCDDLAQFDQFRVQNNIAQ